MVEFSKHCKYYASIAERYKVVAFPLIFPPLTLPVLKWALLGMVWWLVPFPSISSFATFISGRDLGLFMGSEPFIVD